ncbi:TlpA family protein disulfide reductase [Undibacterium fentianense]|uniref:TlpA family protein disulfide reductase n=1 Tax=Undibacterium fentianense TaxID=2828728 RepID=A0A941E2A7_9BURK|nr:TlpA disulfide reductase family protein [Undibacterium fentianense]MBR7799349.1 TlpA family protein disulfide reductase [Undibacterium fentianense]
MKNKTFTISALIIAAVFTAAGLSLGAKKYEPVPATDSAAKQFFSLTLNDLEAKPQPMKQWQGKFLVVNFWATWCKPCVEEMPELKQLQADLKNNNVQLIGMGIDTPSNMQEFAKKYQISYPLYAAGMDGTSVSQQMGNKAGGLPFTALISEDGKVIKTYSGRLKMPELRADITRLNKKS